MEIFQPEVKLLSLTPQAEKLIEEAGRTCYLSLDRITENSSDNFIQAAIRRGHGSILEHASATFRILEPPVHLPISWCATAWPASPSSPRDTWTSRSSIMWCPLQSRPIPMP